jgi:hypothetical protein
MISEIELEKWYELSNKSWWLTLAVLVNQQRILKLQAFETVLEVCIAKLIRHT